MSSTLVVVCGDLRMRAGPDAKAAERLRDHPCLFVSHSLYFFATEVVTARRERKTGKMRT
jgi:hypothetical protein